ncbi:hypothetical protein [Sinomicrobium sp.]
MKKVCVCLSLLLFALSGCTTYYLTPYVKGEVWDGEKPLSDVEIKFVNGATSRTDSSGYFEIDHNKKQYVLKRPDPAKIRMFNSPYIVLEKAEYNIDTIDIREYDFNKSIYVSDTLNLGRIVLKRLR